MMVNNQVSSLGERRTPRVLGGMGRGEWLNIAIDIRAKRSLENLAFSYGVSQRAVLERLLASAEQALNDEDEASPAGGNEGLRPVEPEAIAS